MRQFLLTNAELKEGKIGFRNPLAILDGAIGRIGEFPFKTGEVQWKGPTLFVKGSKSAYINRHNAPRTLDYFPNSVRTLFDSRARSSFSDASFSIVNPQSIVELETGHWVHAEQSVASRGSLLTSRETAV